MKVGVHIREPMGANIDIIIIMFIAFPIIPPD